MQRTSGLGMASIAASCLRRSCVACEAVQQVSRPPSKLATAQEGPMEPCVWIAKSYAAESLRDAAASDACEAPTRLMTSLRTTGVLRTCSQILLWSGRPSHLDHVTANCCAALIALHSLSATTPRKLSMRTTFTTPGI